MDTPVGSRPSDVGPHEPQPRSSAASLGTPSSTARRLASVKESRSVLRPVPSAKKALPGPKEKGEKPKESGAVPSVPRKKKEE